MLNLRGGETKNSCKGYTMRPSF